VVLQFAEDVELVFSNAYLYNKPGSVVFDAAKEVEVRVCHGGAFEKKTCFLY
jgi:hypothetical protein